SRMLFVFCGSRTCRGRTSRPCSIHTRRHHCKGCTPSHIKPELCPGIGNSGRKAGLVNAPQRLEVGGLEITNGEGHAAIVTASAKLIPPCESFDPRFSTDMGCRLPGARQMGAIAPLLHPQPRTYHEHQRKRCGARSAD